MIAINFKLTNRDAAARLLSLIDWLEVEQVRLAAELAKVPDEKPKTDSLGRRIVTDNVRRRQELSHALETAKTDEINARVWLRECEINQEWSVPLEVSRWLNRPFLAQSMKG